MNVLIVSTVKSKWPVLRVGLANVQLLIAVVAIWFLVLLPDHRNGLMWFATAIIVGTLLIAVFDYWSAVSRIEMGSTHVHLVFSLRRVTIEYKDIKQVKLVTTSFHQRLQGTIKLHRGHLPIRFVCAGFSTNWGSMSDTTAKLHKHLVAAGLTVAVLRKRRSEKAEPKNTPL